VLDLDTRQSRYSISGPRNPIHVCERPHTALEVELRVRRDDSARLRARPILRGFRNIPPTFEQRCEQIESVAIEPRRSGWGDVIRYDATELSDENRMRTGCTSHGTIDKARRPARDREAP
jgi:hypothetical protein